jgi:ABC-type glucose/galactose transport system permease subunit
MEGQNINRVLISCSCLRIFLLAKVFFQFGFFFGLFKIKLAFNLGEGLVSSKICFSFPSLKIF